MLLLLICAVIVGGAVPVQTACNTALRGQVGSPFAASLVNGAVGASLLTLVLLGFPSLVSFNLDDLLTLPWWVWSGGIWAVVILVFTIFIMERIGALGTALCMLTGSVIGGLIFDLTGLFNAPQQPFTLVKAAGLLLALAGFTLVLQLPQKFRKHQPKLSLAQLPFIALGLFSGMVQVTQTVVNSELMVHVGSSAAAGWCTMASSAVIILAIMLLKRESFKVYTKLRLNRHSWWILCGGVCGASFLIVNALLIQHIGAGMLVILNIAGQLTAALLIDVCGLFGARRKSASLSQIIGLIIVFAAAAMLKLA